jgi:putative SOS response-associated peptidase YedK
MCGRYASFTPPDAIRQLFRTTNPVPNVAASWNIAPSQQAMVVRRHPESGDRHLDLLTWGLVPHWIKPNDLKSARRPINARAETVASSPMFRSAFKARRCLVVADAWYEWEAGPEGKKPYAFARGDRHTMAFAGISEGWKADAGKVIRSFAIITTTANRVAGTIHDRMPVVLAPDSWATWLGEAPGDPEALLQPAPDDLIEAWPVSVAVNSPRNNNDDLLAPQ